MIERIARIQGKRRYVRRGSGPHAAAVVLVASSRDAGERSRRATADRGPAKSDGRPNRRDSPSRPARAHAVRRSSARGPGLPRGLARGRLVDDAGGIVARRRLESPRLMRRGAVDVGELGHVAADVLAVRVEALGLASRVEDPVGRVSTPVPATHCQLPVVGDVAVEQQVLEVAAPSRQSRPRSLTRNEATIMRARLCIQPSRRSWRMPGVDDRVAGRPSFHASSSSGRPVPRSPRGR